MHRCKLQIPPIGTDASVWVDYTMFDNNLSVDRIHIDANENASLNEFEFRLAELVVDDILNSNYYGLLELITDDILNEFGRYTIPYNQLSPMQRRHWGSELLYNTKNNIL